MMDGGHGDRDSHIDGCSICAKEVLLCPRLFFGYYRPPVEGTYTTNWVDVRITVGHRKHCSRSKRCLGSRVLFIYVLPIPYT